jgi:hypothetical protein
MVRHCDTTEIGEGNFLEPHTIATLRHIEPQGESFVCIQLQLCVSCIEQQKDLIPTREMEPEKKSYTHQEEKTTDHDGCDESPGSHGATVPSTSSVVNEIVDG